MQTKVFEVVCENCQNTWYIKSDTVFHHEFDQKVKHQFYDFSFFHRKCSVCNHLMLFTCPLVYYFQKANCLVSYACEAANEENARCYQATSIEEFVEMLHIVDCDLDIEMVERLKASLVTYEQLRFDGCDNGHLFFNSKQGMLAIEMKNYF